MDDKSTPTQKRNIFQSAMSAMKNSFDSMVMAGHRPSVETQDSLIHHDEDPDAKQHMLTRSSNSSGKPLIIRNYRRPVEHPGLKHFKSFTPQTELHWMSSSPEQEGDIEWGDPVFS